MKLKHLFITLGFAAATGFGLFTGLKADKGEAKEAKAYTPSSGSIIVKDNVGWYEGTGNSQAGKAAVYFYGESTNGWSKSFKLKSGTGNLYLVDYNLSFTPSNMIVVRLKNSAGENPTWDDKAYDNQTKDLAFQQATSLNSWDGNRVNCTQWALSATVNSSTVSYGVKTTLSKVGLGDSGNPEVSGVVTLAENEEFKVVSNGGTWSGYYGCPSALNSCFTGGSKTAPENGDFTKIDNIKCLVAGSYDFFFDTETNKVWISRQDIVDADGYASYFLTNVGCDTTGATSPSGWGKVSTQYASLSNEAKNFLYSATANVGGDNIARCVYWYDYAVRVHPSLTKFMVNSSGVARGNVITPLMISSSSNSTSIVLTVVSSLSLLAIGGFFFMKRKKINL